MLDKATLEILFETGDKPTQPQFAELIQSSLNHIDNKTNIIQGVGIATGTNAYSVNLVVPITSLVIGGIYFIQFQNSNTGASTLSINGITAKPIKERDGNPLFFQAIKNNQFYPLLYDGTNLIIQTVSQKLQDAFNVSIPNNAIISGGVAVWDTGLTFNVSAASYYIQGNYFISLAGSIILDTADPSDDRFDVIALNDNLQIVKITGTPAADPAVPGVDLDTQVFVTSVLVKAGQTQPQITVEDIYLEDTEWVTSDNDPTVWNRADTSDPYAGTKAIKATGAVNGDFVEFESLDFDLDGFDILTFRVKVLSPIWSGLKEKLIFSFWDNSNQIGQIVAVRNGYYNFDENNITNYQEIIIPISDFQLSATIIDKLKIEVGGLGPGGGPNNINFLLDKIILQGNFQIPSIQNIWKTIEADIGSKAAQSPTDILKVKGDGDYISTLMLGKTLTIKGLKNNRTAVTDPGATDDSDAGYSVGSFWQNVSSMAPKVFIAQVVDVGDAVWFRLDNIDHFFLSNIGVNTHASIDNMVHIFSSNNFN